MHGAELLFEARRQTAEAAREQTLEVIRGQRAYATDAARGVVRLNAGGLVTILAFTATVFAKSEPADPVAFVAALKVACISLFIGLVAALAVPLTGYLNHTAIQACTNEYWHVERLVLKGGKHGPRAWSRVAPVYQGLGVVCFAIGVAAFVFAGTRTLTLFDALFGTCCV